MTADETLMQSGDEQEWASEQSSRPARPPAEVPGYDVQEFLGAGTYGQVWVGVDRTTGRAVAIKFYNHRGGLDWSLLSREVEKLVFLSADRYVVQLLDVGWDADPPYYVMEYVENGSLEAHLKEHGTLSANDVGEYAREVAKGLIHAHAKGVLHCDLKPGNVLLDQDNKPRLADFGQSRLTHEQQPALGTVFYMAPEQADMRAVPDARWDVYALGALLYRMLAGEPPHRSEQAVSELAGAADLDERLARYRKLLRHADPPARHQQVRGVDRALSDIISRCLEVNPKRRYPNVQAVLHDLELRLQRRARRPLLTLGIVGPLLLLALMTFLVLRSFQATTAPSSAALIDRSLQSNRFAARYVADAVSHDLERRIRAVEAAAASPAARRGLEAIRNDSGLMATLEELADPDADQDKLAALQKQYQQQADQRRIEPVNSLIELIAARHADRGLPPAASWFVNGPLGNQIARWPASGTLGRNYAWRAYYHGGDKDHDPGWRPGDGGDYLQHASLSPVILSQSSGRWIVAVSAPIRAEDGSLLGVIATTFEVGRVVELLGAEGQFPVLVDRRDGDHQGLILQHPLLEASDTYPVRFAQQEFFVTAARFPDRQQVKENYRDPLGEDESGRQYNQRWLAEYADVTIDGEKTGWSVIVQESFGEAIGTTLDQMTSGLLRIVLQSLALFVAAVMALWGLVLWSYTRAASRGGLGFGGAHGSMSETQTSGTTAQQGTARTT